MPDEDEPEVEPYDGPPDATELAVPDATEEVDDVSALSAVVGAVVSTSTSRGTRESPEPVDEPTVTRRPSDELHAARLVMSAATTSALAAVVIRTLRDLWLR